MSKFAVGYSMKQKMAKGGAVHPNYEKVKNHNIGVNPETDIKGKSNMGLHVKDHEYEEAKGEHRQTMKEMKSINPKLKGLAEGGDVDHEADMVHRILKKCYSEGGKVANGGDDDMERMADSDPNNFDDLALRDDLSSSNSAANSGDSIGGPEMDHEGEDMVKRIMRKRGNPKPA